MVRALPLLVAFLITAGLNVTAAVKRGCRPLTAIGPGKKVQCTGTFDEARELSEHLAQIQDPINTLELREAKLDVLPSNMLQNNTQVTTILLDDVNIKLFNVPELGLSPLEGSKDTIRRMEIYDSDGLFAWDWSLFPKMENLETLIIDNSNLIQVPEYISIFATNLNFLELTNSKLQFIHPQAFNRLTKLGICNLAGNSIRRLKRTMFSVPATHLWSMDFSNNKLESLPEDIFSDMPQLKEIKLHGNYINSITSIKKVWAQLAELWLQNNHLRCPELCWTAEQTNIPLFWSSIKCWYKTNRTLFWTDYASFCSERKDADPD